MDEEPVLTCDGDYMLSQEARQAAKFYYATGFFGLPWLWACNLWLFSPSFRAGSGDPVITACEMGCDWAWPGDAVTETWPHECSAQLQPGDLPTAAP